MSTENFVLLSFGLFAYLAIGFRVASGVLMDADGWYVPVLWVGIALVWLPVLACAGLIRLLVG